MTTFSELKARLLRHAEREFGQGASEAEIAQAESALNLPIRGDYREFLRTFGWGGVGSHELYGLGQDVPEHLNLIAITQSERTEMLPRLNAHLLPIMNDGAGNLYCIDAAADCAPIVFWDHTLTADQIPERRASGFATWLGEIMRHSD